MTMRLNLNFFNSLILFYQKGFLMPGKRSNRKNVQHFCCPYCDRRLWRLGSPKHFIFYSQASEIQQHTNISRKNAAFLANKGTYVDKNAWIEEFFCGEHGKLWLKLSRNNDGISASLAATKDWQQTTRTINPDHPNPSVSEFTYRMSHQRGKKLTYNL